MPDYVYALHDFSPEHEDELGFKAGEKVEIVEKDEVYGDGWWQGRTEDGKVGLFPESYTSPNPPPAASQSPSEQQDSQLPDIRLSGGLLPLEEESDDGASPISPPDRQAGGAAGGGVMQATMTDVQKAIDQLAVNRADSPSRRTFSFASSTHTRETDTEEDDVDEGDWHKDARSRLAEKAQKVNKAAQPAAGSSHERLAPPIPVEMSDESDDEDDLDDDHARPTSPPTAKPNITTFPSSVNGQVPNGTGPVTNTNPVSENHAIAGGSRGDLALSAGIARSHSPDEFSPAMARSELDPEDAIETTPATTLSSVGDGSSPAVTKKVGVPSSEPHPVIITAATDGSTVPPPITVGQPSAKVQSTTSLPTPTSPQSPAGPYLPKQDASRGLDHNTTTKTEIPQLLPAAHIASPQPIHPASAGSTIQALHDAASSSLPSPAASLIRGPSQASSPNTQTHTQAQPGPLSIPMISQHTGQKTNGAFTSTPGPLSAASSGFSPSPSSHRYPYSYGHPTEWTQDQVVEWLKTKGFDEGVVAKFIEHEIDGEVLVQLDTAVLKDEMGIMAFGKRMRIANAIAELRRPSSTVDTPLSSKHVSGSGFGGGSNPKYNDPNNGDATSQGTHANLYHLSQPLHQRDMSLTSTAAMSSTINSPIAPSYSTAGSGGPNLMIMSPSGEINAGAIPESPTKTGGLGISGPGGKPEKLSASSVRSGITSNGRAPSIAGSLSENALVTRTVWSQADRDGDDHKKIGRDSHESQRNSQKGKDSGRDYDEYVLSESEAPSPLTKNVSIRRKAVRASFASSADTKDSSSLPASPSWKSGSTFARKRNSDGATNGAKSHDRLSFFGGSLGKSRKPVPSSSNVSEISDTSPSTTTATDKPARSLSRLYLGSGSHSKRSVSQRAPAPQSMLANSPPAPKSPARGGVLRRRAGSDSNTPAAQAALSSLGQSPTKPVRNYPPQVPPASELSAGDTALEQIGTPDHAGWMRKRGDRYNAWKERYFVLKGHHLYYVKSMEEKKIKGYVNIVGYKVVADENIHPGRYGFRIVHENEKPHFFSSDEQAVVREWMKALMKATIGRDFSRPVVSSCNIPTIPLSVAQAMNPAPRPPSPTAREATQKAMRRDNVNQLSNRDALVLMGMGGEPDATDKARLEQFFQNNSNAAEDISMKSSEPTVGVAAPPRPTREMRRRPSGSSSMMNGQAGHSASDAELINWINSNLPSYIPPAADLSASLSTGLILYRVAESIKGVPTDLPDSAFPTESDPDKLDGLFKLFDFLLDNDVRMGNVSINDVRNGNRDKIVQLVKALKVWQEKRSSLHKGVAAKAMTAGPWLAVGH